MLVACRACDTPVEPSVPSCPYCGVTDPAGGYSSPDNSSSGQPQASSFDGDGVWHAHFQTGLESIAAGNYDDAITSLSQALIDAPESDLGQCYSTRGYAYLCLEDFDRAMDDCNSALEHDPTDGEAFAWRGTANAGLRHWRKSIEDFAEAIQLCPENAAEYRRVATAHSETALEDFRTKVRQGGASAELFRDRAIIYAFRTDFDKAIRDFTQSLDLEPSDTNSMIRRAECYAQAGQLENVIEDCTKAIEFESDDPRAFFLRGSAHLSLGDGQNAIADLTSVIEIDTSNVEAYLHRGQAHTALGNHVAALDDFTSAVRLNRDNNDALVARGSAYVKLGEYARAVKDFTKSLVLVPVDAGTLVRRGEANVQQGEFELALADFDEAISIDAICASAFLGRGKAMQASGDHEGALAEINKAIRLNARYAEAIAFRGKTHHELKKADDALEDYSKALELGLPDEDAADIYYRRGTLHLATKLFNDAKRDFDESIKLSDKRAGAFLWRGIALGKLGDLSPAIDDFNRAIELNRGDESQYRDVGKPIANKAVDYFSRAIHRDSKRASGYRRRGIAYELLGNADDALADFTKALELKPNDLECRLRRAALLASQRRHNDAIDDYDKALKVDPDQATTYHCRAKCLKQLGRSDDAMSDLNRAIEIDGQNADLYIARGELHAATGQPDKAEADFTQAVRVDCRIARAFLQRGLLFAAQANYDDAIRDFTAAIQTGGPNALTHLRRGEAYVQTQRLTKAVRDFEAAIELEPGLVPAHTSRAVTLARQGDYYKAIIELTKALGRIKKDESLANLLQCRAKIYYNIGRFHQSIDDCTSIIQLDPADHNFAHTLLGRGLALLQLGANEEAERNFSKAAQLDPQLKVAESALEWLRDPSAERPAALQPPANKLPPKRPPAVRNPLQLGGRSGKWRTDSLHDQWIVLINDQHEYGPVTKKMLDKWCAEGRLDGKTLLLRVDWDQWRWASDVYREATPETPGESMEVKAAEADEIMALKSIDEGASPPMEDEFPEIELK